ncbi:MAG: hypothetical protein ABIH39_03715 [Candidatus Margulisiibacteriota bacterium]
MSLPLQINKPMQERVESRQKLTLSEEQKEAKKFLLELKQEDIRAYITEKPEFTFKSMLEALTQQNKGKSQNEIIDRMSISFLEKMTEFKNENKGLNIKNPQEYLAALAIKRALKSSTCGHTSLAGILKDSGTTLEAMAKEAMEIKGDGFDKVAAKTVQKYSENKKNSAANGDSKTDKTLVKKEITHMRNSIFSSVLSLFTNKESIQSAIEQFQKGEINADQLVKVITSGASPDDIKNNIKDGLKMIKTLTDMVKANPGRLGSEGNKAVLGMSRNLIHVVMNEHKHMGGHNLMARVALGLDIINTINDISIAADAAGVEDVQNDMAQAGLEIMGRMAQMADEVEAEPEEETLAVTISTDDDLEYLLDSLKDRTIYNIIDRNRQDRDALNKLLEENRKEIDQIEKKIGKMIQKRMKTAEKQQKQKIEKKLAETKQEINAEVTKTEAEPMAANEVKLAGLLLKQEELRQKARGAKSAGTGA